MTPIDLEALALVTGGASLEQRAVAGMKACMAVPTEMADDGTSQPGCVDEQRRRLYRARELYGAKGDGVGGSTGQPIPKAYFLGEQ